MNWRNIKLSSRPLPISFKEATNECPGCKGPVNDITVRLNTVTLLFKDEVVGGHIRICGVCKVLLFEPDQEQ